MNIPGTQTAPPESVQRFRRFWRGLRLLLLALLLTAGIAVILLFPILPVRTPFDLKLGDVAPEDILAPREISYTSQIETEAARAAAAASVDDIFDAPDPRIVRQQVRRARQIMDFVQDVRADPFAGEPLKHSYLQAITLLSLSQETRDALLDVSDEQFDLVEREVVVLIEDAMSGTVQEGRVSEVIERLDLKVSADMPEELIPLVLSLARGLIVPNSALNEVATEAAREQALQAVPEIRRTFQPGEVVIRAGERVDELDIEALAALGMGSQALTWKDAASALLISLLVTVLLAVYISTYDTPWLDEPGHLLLFVALFLLFLVAAQIMVPQGGMAYLFPGAALVMAGAALAGVHFAALLSIVLALVVGYLADGSLQLAAYTAVAGLLAAGTLRRASRLNAFFLSGLVAAVGGLAVLLAFQLPNPVQPVRIAQLSLFALLSGLFSAGLALVILFAVGNLTGIPTSLRLLDLMRPDHPLQKKLQREALGTYQHTLSVANLVEAAAEAIGADSLLARVGTLYHDIGKTSNPGFFIENRTEGSLDPHKGLSPLASARIIKAHVSDGIELARRYRLPPRLIDFIAEHHGTLSIAYFLHEAREEAQAAGIALNERPFYYSGPSPRSPETAILMLADGCESATRANRAMTREDVDEVVTHIIQQRIDQHQLDDSGLTLTQIKTIKDTFARTLSGMYHPRVVYPTDRQPELPPPPAGQLEAGTSKVVEGQVAEEARAAVTGDAAPLEGDVKE